MRKSEKILEKDMRKYWCVCRLRNNNHSINNIGTWPIFLCFLRQNKICVHFCSLIKLEYLPCCFLFFFFCGLTKYWGVFPHHYLWRMRKNKDILAR
jgi:hypothetical protein